MSSKSAGKKAWETNPRIGIEAMRSGDFGESFVAYLLSKKGVDVVRASTVGFDLFAIDPVGGIFPKNKIVGISVKTRISKTHNKFVPTIPIGESKIRSSMKRWRIEGYVGLVVRSQEEKSFAVFLFPIKNLKKLSGRAKRKDVVAVSKLDGNRFVNRLYG